MQDNPEFCPIPDTVRPIYCKLVEGQIVSVDKPCPHRDSCCQLIEDLAACYAADAALSNSNNSENHPANSGF